MTGVTASPEPSAEANDLVDHSPLIAWRADGREAAVTTRSTLDCPIAPDHLTVLSPTRIDLHLSADAPLGSACTGQDTITTVSFRVPSTVSRSETVDVQFTAGDQKEPVVRLAPLSP